LKEKYIVFRIFSPKEEEFEIGPAFYGWSNDKKIIKAFIKQRGKHKYVYRLMNDDEITCQSFSQDTVKEDTKIKLLMLPSTNDGITYPLFITDRESKEVEVKIHLYFSELASFEKYNNHRKVLITLYWNLIDEAKQVLENIGFIPKELNDCGYMESESTFTCLENEIETLIEEAYNTDDYIEPTDDDFDRRYTPKSQLYLNDFHSHLCYSLEAYIKILKDEFE